MKEIKLRNSNKSVLVDDEDFEELSKVKWYLHKKGYAISNAPGMKKMHRYINKTPKGMLTDHIDRNKLNNQKANLRTCTNGENVRNGGKKSDGKGSKYRGVSIVKYNNKKNTYYIAQICFNGKRKIRVFPFTPEGEILAAKAYNKLAREHFGEFACENVIP